ncbi:MAG: hypothetical protein ABI593_12925 [Betaproteobacteria bacterium]
MDEVLAGKSRRPLLGRGPGDDDETPIGDPDEDFDGEDDDDDDDDDEEPLQVLGRVVAAMQHKNGKWRIILDCGEFSRHQAGCPAAVG